MFSVKRFSDETQVRCCQSGASDVGGAGLWSSDAVVLFFCQFFSWGNSIQRGEKQAGEHLLNKGFSVSELYLLRASWPSSPSRLSAPSHDKTDESVWCFRRTRQTAEMNRHRFRSCYCVSCHEGRELLSHSSNRSSRSSHTTHGRHSSKVSSRWPTFSPMNGRQVELGHFDSWHFDWLETPWRCLGGRTCTKVVCLLWSCHVIGRDRMSPLWFHKSARNRTRTENRCVGFVFVSSPWLTEDIWRLLILRDDEKPSSLKCLRQFTCCWRNVNWKRVIWHKERLWWNDSGRFL